MTISLVGNFLSNLSSDGVFGGFAAIYRATHHKARPSPLRRHRNCSGVRVGKQRLLQEAGIREDLVIVQDDHSDRPYAVGTNRWRSGDAVIYIPAHDHDVDPARTGFLMNREIAHLRSDDAVKGGVAVAVNDLARLAILGIGSVKIIRALSRGRAESVKIVRASPRRGVWSVKTVRTSPLVRVRQVVVPLAGMAVACFVGNRMVDAVFRWQEAKADDFAIANATDEELRGGWRHFTSLRGVNADLSKGVRALFDPFGPLGIWWALMRWSSGGEDLFDYGQPLLKDRIRKIEEATDVRKLPPYGIGTTDRRKMERLRVEEVRKRMGYFGSGGGGGPYARAMHGVLESMLSEERGD
ncbi:MAG: hypothetical protein OXF02_06620 [Simkaniaceae bacterium]|nr:hypothetical protein [Simkaniaceae bacterium]